MTFSRLLTGRLGATYGQFIAVFGGSLGLVWSSHRELSEHMPGVDDGYILPTGLYRHCMS